MDEARALQNTLNAINPAEADASSRSMSTTFNNVTMQRQKLLLRSSAATIADDEETNRDCTADHDGVANLYSYCMEVSLSASSPRVLLRNMFQLSLLIGVQVFYSYGYLNASVFLLFRSFPQFEGFRDSMDTSLWYSDSVVSGTFTPFVQMMCSLASIVLLCIMMKDDNKSSLLTTGPLVELILCPTESDLPPEERRGSHIAGYMRRAGFVLRCLFLQLLASMLMAFTPMLACLGAAGNFAGAEHAQEIVLNSVGWQSPLSLSSTTSSTSALSQNARTVGCTEWAHHFIVRGLECLRV